VSSTAADESFCDVWAAALPDGDEDDFDEVLRLAPDELKDNLIALRETEGRSAGERGTPSAAREVFDWVELHCEQGGPGASTRRVAPPVDAVFDGLTFCETTSNPTGAPSPTRGMALYGRAGAGDPYDGPMLGLLWNPTGDEMHIGDGDANPVTVRGHEGAAAPITVFQQVVLPELGTVVAWTEGDRVFGLYGRLWPIDRAGELVEIAEGIEERSGQFGIADDALPDGYDEIFAGAPDAAALVVTPSSIYSLRFQGAGGLLKMEGLQMSEREFEAFRFFTVGIERGEVAGRDALVGNAWNDSGPAVVTWREQDGLVVRIVGLGVPLATAQEVAARSRELSEAEWKALVEADDGCSDPLPLRR
jgi:hypothetical protein